MKTHLQQFLFVGIGGFIGAILRFLVSTFAQNILRAGYFPAGTLAVNILGCLVIGMLGAAVEQHDFFRLHHRMLLIVGVLGSFTTFSTFGHETITLLRDQKIPAAFVNIALHLILGLTAVVIGFKLVHRA